MSMEMLDASKVQNLIDESGRKNIWVIRKIGLSRTAGYQMLRDGILPKDAEVKRTALEKLAEILGVEVGDLLLNLKAKRTA